MRWYLGGTMRLVVWITWWKPPVPYLAAYFDAIGRIHWYRTLILKSHAAACVLGEFVRYAVSCKTYNLAPARGNHSVQCPADQHYRQRLRNQHRHSGLCGRMFLGRRCGLQTCERRL